MVVERLARVAACLLCVVMGAAAAAQERLSESAAPALAEEVDRIVAVVNDEPITLFELRSRVQFASSQLRAQGTELPPREVMERQVLERLIVDSVQMQFAKETGIR